MTGFETLQELGAKKIAADTHIPIAHIEMILSKKFDGFTKPQFFGFISILEREYKLDLAELKQEYLFVKAQETIAQEDNFDLTESGTKLVEQSKHLLENKKVIYGGIAAIVIILLIVLVSSFDFSSSTENKAEINNTAIDKAKKNLNIKPVEIANVEEAMANNDVESAEHGQDDETTPSETKQDTKALKTDNAKNKKSAGSDEPVSNSEPTMALYFRIVPKGRLWLGLIDTETHRRRVETITEPLILDAEKEWLIVTGYGHLDMDCGDTTHKFREDKKLLLLYENGICQIIDKEEFKARNRGKLW